MGQFSMDLNEAISHMSGSAGRVTADVVIEVTDDIQDLTPYGKPELWKTPAPPGYEPGTLKGNWQFAKGSPDLSTSSPKDITGSNSKAKVRSVMNSNRNQGDATYYFTNNVDHAYPVEFGHSRLQAPQGMLRRAVSQFATKVEKAAKREMARS